MLDNSLFLVEYTHSHYTASRALLTTMINPRQPKQLLCVILSQLSGMGRAAWLDTTIDPLCWLPGAPLQYADRLWRARRQVLDSDSQLNAFLQQVERRAYRMAYLGTGNKEEALDIVQDAMFKLVQRYRNKPSADWPALFFRILQSRLRDWYRRQKVRNRWRVWLAGDNPSLDDPHANDFHNQQHHLPEHHVASSQIGDALDDALRRLPLRQQQAFLLRAWEGLDVSQTALAMNCSPSSVKTHYARALQALRQQLGEHWS